VALDLGVWATLRPQWGHGPDTAGGLLAASCQKQGKGRVRVPSNLDIDCVAEPFA